MQLQYITTAEGVQEVIAAIREQAQLDFQAGKDTDTLFGVCTRGTSSSRCWRGHVCGAWTWTLSPSASSPSSQCWSHTCPPPKEGEAPKLQFSAVESALSGFHHLVGLNKIRSIALQTTANRLDVSDQRKRTSSQSGAMPSSRYAFLQRSGRNSSPILFDSISRVVAGGTSRGSRIVATSHTVQAVCIIMHFFTGGYL